MQLIQAATTESGQSVAHLNKGIPGFPGIPDVSRNSSSAVTRRESLTERLACHELLAQHGSSAPVVHPLLHVRNTVRWCAQQPRLTCWYTYFLPAWPGHFQTLPKLHGRAASPYTIQVIWRRRQADQVYFPHISTLQRYLQASHQTVYAAVLPFAKPFSFFWILWSRKYYFRSWRQLIFGVT